MSNKKKYLIIPSVPTPNGRLHLGHIGGPYLSADITTRFLHSQGHTALIVCGTDSYESYVTAQASKEKKDPKEICHFYHPLIEQDLINMDISLDKFINPLAHCWQEKYQYWHGYVVNQLTKKNYTRLVKEKIRWDSYNQRYETGCWLTGYCPWCMDDTESYFCETCGAHYRPENIIHHSAATESQVFNLFLKLPTYQKLLTRGMNNKIINNYIVFLKQQKKLMRLTANSPWGIQYNKDSTLFSYGFVFAYFLMMGEYAGTLLNCANPFLSSSSVTTIATMGHDNAIPFLASSLGISHALSHYKSFDYYLVNYFYHLEGKKFSTSANHAIFVHEIIEKKGLSSDIIRSFLASINVRKNSGDFVVEHFVNYYNNTIEWINHFLISNVQTMTTAQSSISVLLQQQIKQLLSIQKTLLSPENFRPNHAMQLLPQWLALSKNLSKENYFWWLQGLSLFLYPFMPKLSKSLWLSLGYFDFPQYKYLFLFPNNVFKNCIKFDFKKLQSISLTQ